MNTSLLFTKSQSLNAQSLLSIGKRNRPAAYIFLLLMMLGITNANAQTSKVIPDSNVSGSFLGPLANSARTYQMLIDDSQLTDLAGKYLTSISFRLLSSASVAWPAAATTYSSYQIYLSNGVDPAARQLDFAANVIGTQTMVRSGSLVIPAGSFTAGGDPNAFSYSLMFDTPYLYSGGNLIIEIRHTGSDGSSTSTHSVGSTNTTAGYGTLFSACWQGTTTVNNGNFSYVKINSVDMLSVKSVEIGGGFSVYPNPAKDNLHVKSERDIVEFSIFNMVGQKVLSQKNSTKDPQISVAGLANGVYVIQITDKDGNLSSTRFVKE